MSDLKETLAAEEQKIKDIANTVGSLEQLLKHQDLKFEEPMRELQKKLLESLYEIRSGMAAGIKASLAHKPAAPVEAEAEAAESDDEGNNEVAELKKKTDKQAYRIQILLKTIARLESELKEKN